MSHHPVLSDIERDASLEVAQAFARVVSRYFESTRDASGPVSTPLTASVVLVRDEADLEAAFSQRAPYFFHANHGERRWDQGLRSLTCSRLSRAE
jgi:hypothetical protein